MIMPPWRASGVRSKMSLSITVATRQGSRPSGRSLNTSRSSTIGKDGKHGWGTYPRLSMSGGSMQGRLLHENTSCPLLTSGVSYLFKIPLQGSLTRFVQSPFDKIRWLGWVSDESRLDYLLVGDNAYHLQWQVNSILNDYPKK